MSPFPSLTLTTEINGVEKSRWNLLGTCNTAYLVSQLAAKMLSGRAWNKAKLDSLLVEIISPTKIFPPSGPLPINHTPGYHKKHKGPFLLLCNSVQSLNIKEI